jgi:transcriptional regulator with XRE-family HTH domain
METFAKKLEALRKGKGLTQGELACDLRIAQASISNYETGATTPDIEILKRIADYFRVPVTYLFSDDKFSFYTNENNGGNSGYMVNSTFCAASEKLIEFYELLLKEKDKEIASLKKT